jgi:hypothetical protein
MPAEPTYTDGNALAGPLAEMFAVDVTVAATTCAGCGRRSAIAQLHVYSAGPGTIARCPGCQDAVLRYARTPTAAILDLRGTISLSVPIPTA